MFHYPVMLENVLKNIKNLNIMRPLRVADCNFGLGGHSEAILKNFNNTSIKAWQLDSSMIQKYRTITKQNYEQAGRLQIYNQNFSMIPTHSKQFKFDILLADLGFNSLQLQDRKGFSWNKDTELDMRYSGNGQTCEQLVIAINRLSYLDLIQILVKYGDLNSTQAKLAAKQIQNAKPIKTTFQLRDCVVGCFQKGKTRKIAQIFQAFRIATNRQFESLKNLLSVFDSILNPGALVMIITFHSLERILVSNLIKENKQIYGKIQIKKPSKAEILQNTRSKSAELLEFRKKK